MAGRLSGKTCLVTEATQGIGKAVSDAFLRKGAQILVRDLQLERLSTEFAHTAAHIVRVDATDAVEVAAVATAHPQARGTRELCRRRGEWASPGLPARRSGT